MLYFGTVELNMPEERFWDTTPRKFKALTEAAIEFRSSKSGGKNEPEFGYIDQIPGW